MPDVFVPVERNTALKFYNESVNKGILYQFTFDYTDGNRSKFSSYKDATQFDKSFSVSSGMYSEYITYAEKNGIKYSPAETAASQLKINELMKSYIARNLYDSKGFYPIYLRTDKTFQKAIEEFAKK
jgi:carboxyl-terminal processing protease